MGTTASGFQEFWHASRSTNVSVRSTCTSPRAAPNTSIGYGVRRPFQPWPGVRLHALGPAGASIERDECRLVAAPLDHTIDVLGWRVEERTRRHLLNERLDAFAIVGSDRGRLIREGCLETPAGRVHIDDVSETRPGQRFAFLMDTALCDTAVGLAEGADLAVCESTYLDDEADLADRNRHLTARQAAWITSEAGARQLVLTHFSQRHGDRAGARPGSVGRLPGRRRRSRISRSSPCHRGSATRPAEQEAASGHVRPQTGKSRPATGPSALPARDGGSAILASCSQRRWSSRSMARRSPRRRFPSPAPFCAGMAVKCCS